MTTQVHRDQFQFLHPLRVRWAEADLQGIVFNGHYLTYFDIANLEYWRALGITWPDGFAALGGDLFVRKASVEYHAPARFDDSLEVGMRVTRIGESSVRFEPAIFRGDTLLVTGDMVYVFADAQARRPLRVPDGLRSRIAAFERRDPAWLNRQVEGGAATPARRETQDLPWLMLGDWNRLMTPARAVRTAVFIEEQGIAREEEWDDWDARSLHAVVFSGTGRPLATGRLLPDGHVGRMAVLADVRNQGLGARVLQALMQAARLRGDTELVLHAQLSASRFYARHGFVPTGPVFDEVGIPHQKMVWRQPA